MDFKDFKTKDDRLIAPFEADKYSKESKFTSFLAVLVGFVGLVIIYLILFR